MLYFYNLGISLPLRCVGIFHVFPAAAIEISEAGDITHAISIDLETSLRLFSYICS
jgi:hypothetical protein